jgi:glutamine synthetase
VGDFVTKNGINTVKVGAVDIDGTWRGKQIAADYFVQGVFRDGTHIADILFGWDVQDRLISNLTYTGWHTGYPDITLVPDLTTLAIVPWESGTASVICDMLEKDGTPVVLSPRTLLAEVVERAKAMGYVPIVSYEFEFYIFKQSAAELAASHWRDLKPLTDGGHTYSMYRYAGSEGVIAEIRQLLSAYGIDIEATNGEHGPGQFEINIHHCEAVQAADNATMLKHAVKEIAARHGYLASFMAKIKPDWAGSSGHVHQSLRDLNGAAAFANPTSPKELSEVGNWYLAGLVALAPELSAIYLPTINSYKRTMGGSWAGANASWGYDNRTVSIRALPAAGAAARVENRIAGADTNPYLVIAANILSGLHGIRERLPAPRAVCGNAYEAPPEQAPALPGSLAEASDILDKSKQGRLLLGDTFVDHFVATRRWEIREFGKYVTDWEIARFIEMI